MEYFKYTDKLDIQRMLKIYDVVVGLTAYAKSIYKSLYKDALDKAFFHILDKYDENLGELEHYATKVVSKILLGKYSHEIEHDIALETGMNALSFKDSDSNPLNVYIDKEEYKDCSSFHKCVDFLSERFIYDYKLFISQKSENRKCSYEGLFSMFQSDIVILAMRYLIENYGAEMERLGEISKNCRYRSFDCNRYKKSLDPNVDYLGMFNGTVLYSTDKRSLRYFFLFDIKETVDNIVSTYYREDSKLIAKVEKYTAYCTLSGKIVTSIKDLKVELENEIVGAILAKLPYFNVVAYERGREVIFSSSREFVLFSLYLWGNEYEVNFKRLTSKRVVKRRKQQC